MHDTIDITIPDKLTEFDRIIVPFVRNVPQDEWNRGSVENADLVPYLDSLITKSKTSFARREQSSPVKDSGNQFVKMIAF